MKLLFSILLLFTPLCSWATDSIEQGIRLFNQKEYTQAQEILLEESRKGSAYATYWLGVVQYKNGKHFEAGDTFLKAAEMGSPWAMAMLFENNMYVNSPCSYLGWGCDDAWKDKAIKAWEEQAKNGNGKALYAINANRRDWWEYIPFYRSGIYKEIAREAIKNGGYRYFNYSRYWDSNEEKISYLKLAADKGYAPAMVSLYYYVRDTNPVEAEKWLYKALKLGYSKAVDALFNKYFLKKNGYKDYKKSYYYNKLSEKLGGRKENDNLFLIEGVEVDGMPIFDDEGKRVTRRIISQEEQDELDRQVEEFVKDIKINLFLDETSIELF
ncbi:sel1 repeat family protein [Vibrio penaeicida]|uniref:sel1 repeat family protein n=1 Tax=Vibrio penaeicida TaxID=104609 RepID=UPI00273487D3|nr:sel1 repeat family protein [Vibrio penaeicida]MDP2574128.1 sel1 repeat family protein [Vibrio penaeicida]